MKTWWYRNFLSKGRVPSDQDPAAIETSGLLMGKYEILNDSLAFTLNIFSLNALTF